MCNCSATPQDDQDLEALMMDQAEQEREILDRAEAQRPDWFAMAQSLCLPSLAASISAEPKNILTIASNVPVSGDVVRAMQKFFPDDEIQYRPINQESGEIEERVA